MEYVVSYINQGDEEYESFITKTDAINQVKELINSEGVESVQIFERLPFNIQIELI